MTGGLGRLSTEELTEPVHGFGRGAVDPVLVVVHQVSGSSAQRRAALASLARDGIPKGLRVHVFDALAGLRTAFPLGAGFDPQSVALDAAPPATNSAVEEAGFGNQMASLHIQLEVDRSEPSGYLIVHVSEQPLAGIPDESVLQEFPTPVTYICAGSFDSGAASHGISRSQAGSLTAAYWFHATPERLARTIHSALTTGTMAVRTPVRQTGPMAQLTTSSGPRATLLAADLDRWASAGAGGPPGVRPLKQGPSSAIGASESPTYGLTSTGVEGELHRLAKAKAVAIRAGVARSPHVSADTIRLLAGDRRDDVMREVVANATTPGDVLERLASSEEERDWLRQKARHELAARDRKLAGAGGRRVPGILDLAEREPSIERFEGTILRRAAWQLEMGLSIATAEELASLARHMSASVRAVVARRADTPVATLRLLANDGEFVVLQNLATNPSTPSDVLTHLRNDPLSHLSWFKARTMRKKHGDSEIMNGLCRALAANPSTPVKLLVEFSESPDPEVSACVAANRGAPPFVLANLARDLRSAAGSLPYQTPIRAMVASNPSTSEGVLVHLAQDASWAVIAGLASNEASPTPILLDLVRRSTALALPGVSKNDHRPIQFRLASNAHTPAEGLAILASVADSSVAGRVVSNPLVDAHVLGLIDVGA